MAVTASGDFSTWPVSSWIDRPGLKVVAEKDKGQFRMEAAADAAAGTYWIRLTNADGASALKPFVVGTLPEVAESETNDTVDKAQVVEPRVIVNGKLGKSGDLDGYRVELKRGQTLVASLQANTTLGAPMDALLQVCQLVPRPAVQSRSGGGSAADPEAPHLEAFVVAQNHDAVGLDPQIAFTVPHDGDYLVRVFAFPATPDSSIRFAGGDDYLYRLTLTTGPFIDHALPLSVPREESPIRLGGWNLEAAAAAIVPALSAAPDPLTPPDDSLAWIWRADAAGAIALPRTEHAIASAGARPLPVPTVTGGCLASPGQADHYVVVAAKDQKLRIRVAAKALGYPTDPVIAVLDDKGQALAEADDTGRDDRDPQLDFTPPAAGHYTIVVRDLANRGDARLVYRLTIEPVQPDFALSLVADSFVLEKDKLLEISVNVTVRDGLREPIEIRAVGLPPGVTAQPVKFEPTGDSPAPNSGGGRRGNRGKTTTQAGGPSVKLILKADSAVIPAGGFPFRIEGTTSGENPNLRSARFPLNLPLAGQHYAAWLTVKK